MAMAMRAHGVVGAAVAGAAVGEVDMADMVVVMADGATAVGVTVGIHISVNYKLQIITSTQFISGYPYWGLNGGYGGYWG